MKISTNEPKEVVLGLGKALNDESFQIARRYVSDDMKYVGPFGSRDGAEAYLQEIERLRLKFDIQKIFAGTYWEIFAAVCPNPIEALFAPITFNVDREKRCATIRIPGIAESDTEPIKNPVTGEEHRARIALPNGFEYKEGRDG